MQTIYKITNRFNGKIYVGKTSETKERRWSRHVCHANKGGKAYFSKAIRKYGRDAFYVEKIAEADTDEWAFFQERMWILVLGSANRTIGYNSTYGGEGFSTGDKNPNFGQDHSGLNNPNFGKVVSIEIRQRISKTLTGRYGGEKNPFFGKKHSPELLKQIGNRQRGVKRGPHLLETKEKIRVKMLGREFTPETLEKMRQAKMGVQQPIEHINNAAEARKQSYELKIARLYDVQEFENGIVVTHKETGIVAVDTTREKALEKMTRMIRRQKKFAEENAA
jgi:group I intron endonuclease